MNSESQLQTRWTPLIQQYGAYLALIPALAAMLGSLYYSEIRHFIPCTLCWYQRILMYPLVLILLIGIIKQDEYLSTYVLPFSMIGLGISIYHYLIQIGVLSAGTACSGGVPCGTRYVNLFGFVTIPFMALIAFALITIIMGAVKLTEKKV